MRLLRWILVTGALATAVGCGDTGEGGSHGGKPNPDQDGAADSGAGAGGFGTGSGGAGSTGGSGTGTGGLGGSGTGGDGSGTGGDGSGTGGDGSGTGGDGSGTGGDGSGTGGDGSGTGGDGSGTGGDGSGTGGVGSGTGGTGSAGFDAGADGGPDGGFRDGGPEAGTPGADGGNEGGVDGGPDGASDAGDGGLDGAADAADGRVPVPVCSTSADCGDFDVCDGATVCLAGVCVPLAAPTCRDDADPCTSAACDPVAGCIQRRLTGTSCDDGDPCTTVDVCASGVCTGTEPADCDDGNVCTDERCLAGIGCLVSPNSKTCNDGNACTTDSCFNGSCRGVLQGCDDGNPCTADSCDPAGGCVHTPVANGTTCPSDGNPCTTDTCQTGQCNRPVPANTLQCRAASCSTGASGSTATEQAFCDGNGSCPSPTTASCGGQPCNQAGTGCQGACSADANCPNGFYCTSLGACAQEQPVGGACTRNGQCANDRCVDGRCCSSACGGGNPNDCQACNVTPGTCTSLSGTSCNDGSACTTADVCAAGTCGGTQVSCDDGNPCTVETCNPVTGCTSQAAPNGTTCNDGSACTVGDSCVAGSCQPGTPLTCDDGAFCNGQETCDAATGCKAGTPVVCPSDGASCTADFCDETLNVCRSVAQDSACSDSLFCNGVERCDPDASPAASGCVAGTPPSCDDGVGCTTNACDEANDRCSFTPVNAQCGDGNVCNGTETCDATLGCRAGTNLACDDGVACTTNSCNPSSGCVYTPSNAACDNGLYCDGVETCTLTGCKDGTQVACAPTDVIACTVDACDETQNKCVVRYDNTLCQSGQACTSAGCGASCTTNANCSDGNACNGAETCDLSLGSPGRCVAGTPPPPCNDGKSCTVDACNPSTGTCEYSPDDTACLDANVCNGDETCAPGAGANATTGCRAGTPLVCSDTFACTTTSCSPQFGCQVQVDNDYCDDGIVCNGTETCTPLDPNHGPDGCVSTGPVECPDDGVACTTESCSEALGGCVAKADNSQCPCGQTCSASGGGCGNFCNVATCQGQVYKCGDCLDNDGDCKIDTLGDEHCLGPCSDNEGGFKGEISGQDHGNCTADCYFDKDDGAGNDTCGWDHDCDPLSINYPGTPGTPYPDYTPSRDSKCDYSNNNAAKTTSCAGMKADQPDTCFSTAPKPAAATKWNYCGALVPNGCDCFGCCVIPGAPTPVFLGSRLKSNDPGTCNILTLGDPTKCYACTQVTSCMNTCENCEICVGKPELPPECTCQTCAPGQQLCGGSCGAPCPAGEFCLTGCCVPNPE